MRPQEPAILLSSSPPRRTTTPRKKNNAQHQSSDKRSSSRSVVVYLAFASAFFLISQSFLSWHLPALHNYYHLRSSSPSSFFVKDNNNKKKNDPSYDAGYDIVTLVHHDDMETWLQYGLQSWVQHFLVHTAPDAHIYAIASPQAFEAITKAKQQQQQNSLILRQQSSNTTTGSSVVMNNIFERVIPVPESLFPFTLNGTQKQAILPSPEGKPTWIYQQLLKLYAYQVLSSPSSHDKVKVDIPPIKQLFLLIDSDTVAVRPMSFLTAAAADGRSRPIYNIASNGTGAFPTDGDAGNVVVPEVFQNTVPKAFPDHNGQRFTAITHHMMIDGVIMMEMLSAIERIHNGTPAVQVLCQLRNWLSEWELYMAWIMQHHRTRIAVMQIPYVNWGTCDAVTLEFLRQERDVYYLTKHDNFLPSNRCCVNSNWDSTDCYCCPVRDCGDLRINCQVLGIAGCRDDADKGLMLFDIVDGKE